MPLMSDAEADAYRDASRIGLFFRLAGPEPLCLWAGVGDCDARMGIVVGEERFEGIGGISEIPELVWLLNGVAREVNFALNGLDDGVYSRFVNVDEVIGERVDVGMATFDEGWQIDVPPVSQWRGTAETLRIEEEPASRPGAAAIRRAVLGTSIGDTGRLRQTVVLWTEQHHHINHPGDSFFSFTIQYQRMSTVAWPRS